MRGRLSYSGKTATFLYFQPRSKQTCLEKGAARRRQRRSKKHKQEQEKQIQEQEQQEQEQ